DERLHQNFAIGTFRAIADRDPALGRRLAREMIEARDWVQQVYPRRAALADLVQIGVLPPEATKLHDSFLASLGDRIQEALGVLRDKAHVGERALGKRCRPEQIPGETAVDGVVKLARSGG